MTLIDNIKQAKFILNHVTAESVDRYSTPIFEYGRNLHGHSDSTNLIKFGLNKHTKDEILISLADKVVRCLVSNGLDIDETNLKLVYVT